MVNRNVTFVWSLRPLSRSSAARVAAHFSIVSIWNMTPTRSAHCCKKKEEANRLIR